MLGFLAWLALLVATAVLAELAFHFDLTHIAAAFQGLSLSQQIAAALIILLALALIASTLRQSYRIARHEKDLRSLHGGMAGARKAAALAGTAQKDFDAAIQHLGKSDPEDALAALQKQIGETEARAALQRGRNVAVDMQERLDDIRRRQQALREQIGEIAEKRRAIEPVFEELRDRQRQLDRSLDRIETDDNSGNFIDRLKEFDQKAGGIQARHQTLQDSFAMLSRFKDELAKSQADLARLQVPEGGIKALLGELETRYGGLVKAIEALETAGEGQKLSAHVEALDSGKKDAEQRIARLEGSFAMLDAIRRDFVDFRKRQEDISAALAEVETDSNGQSLAERLGELDQFSAQARSRLRSLQEILTTLNRYRRDLTHSQTELAPLHAPGNGIHALIEELNGRRAELSTALDGLESSGDEKLSSRVEALADSKRATEQRIAQVYQHFAQLESIRNEIAGTFASLNSALSKLVV